MSKRYEARADANVSYGSSYHIYDHVAGEPVGGARLVSHEVARAVALMNEADERAIATTVARLRERAEAEMVMAAEKRKDAPCSADKHEYYAGHLRCMAFWLATPSGEGGWRGPGWFQP